MLAPLRPAWTCFFVGAALVAFGSGWYRWAPGNATLVWDRLPMTRAFMAFSAIMLGEQISLRLGHVSLVPLLLVGMASVVNWHLSDVAGRGDLRRYAAVQFVQMLLAPLLLLLYRPGLTRVRLVWGVLAAYLLAKLLEAVDAALFDRLGIVSGHSLKHLAAAVAAPGSAV